MLRSRRKNSASSASTRPRNWSWSRTPINPCPCCGRLVLDETPGAYATYPVRFREDDAIQFQWPTMDGGANKVSLTHQRPGRPRPSDPPLPVLAGGRRPHVRRLRHRPGLGTRLD
ncbi:CPCC family cysteine-rich protein [Streptomyces sp. NPDC127117]|uniref:CPCC family cysteine-rich protein n=1 Tax=Streptomyces sp. NPDC127117 TaxID=3345368 RepID=UPI003639B2D7